MATLIETINAADSIANLWRTGTVAALSAQERLADIGFYAVTIGERTIVAWLNGHRFELPAV
mgnify:CR=1 FL=1